MSEKITFIDPPIFPVETTGKAGHFSLSEDWLAVVLGLGLLGFTFLSIVKIPW